MTLAFFIDSRIRRDAQRLAPKKVVGQFEFKPIGVKGMK
jgi:hypothetical protein